MRKEIINFIFKIFILILPLCFLFGFVEYKLKKIPNGYNKKRELLESQLDSINVLALGASQTLFAVNPDYFSCKGFNLSNVSQSLYYDTQLTLKYIDKMKNLKCVIVSISYYTFWYQLSDGIDEWRDYYYFHFWDIKYPDLKFDDPKIYSLIMLYTPQTSLGYAKRFFNINLSENLSQNGWLKIDTISNNQNISEKSGKDRVEFHDKNRFVFRFKETTSMLENFVNECQKRKIDVVFITTPVLPTYYKYTNPVINQKNTNAINELCKKYDCKYFDYFRDGRFTNKDFNDNDHMNFIGAEKFSKILDTDIVSKIFSNKQINK